MTDEPGNSAWTITITGYGPHHSSAAADADRVFKAFVETLKMQGQSIVTAHFTWGKREHA